MNPAYLDLRVGDPPLLHADARQHGAPWWWFCTISTSPVNYGDSLVFYVRKG